MITNYEAAEKIQMDNLSALRQSHLEGVEIGREEGIAIGEERNRIEKQEMARKMKAKGLPTDLIIELTGLSQEEIVILD